jgi:hypothetical protein
VKVAFICRKNCLIYSAFNTCVTLKLHLALVIGLYLCFSYHNVYFYVVRFTAEGESVYCRVQYFCCWLLEAVLMLQSKWVNNIAKILKVVSHHLYLHAMRKFVEAKRSYGRNKS